jgi:thiol:disulfide interchange protein DsbD
MLVYGVLVMVGVAGGGGDLFRPLKGVALVSGEGAERELEFRHVKGIDGLNAELRPAAARGQVVMFDYYADWCVSCKEMERFTFSDPTVQAALSNVLLLQTDVTDNDALDQALLAEFDLFGPPAIQFFAPDGRERRELRVVGYMDADDFLRVVERAIGPSMAVSASRPNTDGPKS